MTCQAWYADSVVYQRQLDYMNVAESSLNQPRFHARRISFVSTILEDDFGADDVVKPLSAEDQELLSWQARTENLQNDVEVHKDLTLLTERLCPYKNICLTLSSKVTDRDSHPPSTAEPHPLSAYRHVSFRCAMLTEHSTADGRVQPLFSYDGLRDRDFLRWRSHDYINLVLLEPRPSFRVFWLVQWDIVDMLDPIISDGGHDATLGPRIMKWRPCNLDRLDADRCQGDSTEEVPNFHGVRVRRDAKRKSQWIAEVRRKGKKIWLGSYRTVEEAGRASDAGQFYCNKQITMERRFNLEDSPLYLPQNPSHLTGGLSDKEIERFVIKEAHRLASIPPSGWVSEKQASSSSWAQGFSSPQPPAHVYSHTPNCSSSRKQLPPNGNLVEALPRSDNRTALHMDSERDPHKNWPSTSYHTDVLREVAGSSSNENLVWLGTSNGNLTGPSQASARVCNPGLEQTDLCEPSLPPITKLSYPEENAKTDISNETEWGGFSDLAYDSGLHHETESGNVTALQGLGPSQNLGAESEYWTYDDLYFFDCLFGFPQSMLSAVSSNETEAAVFSVCNMEICKTSPGEPIN